MDIEREAHLGGKLHSKGVLILGGYLGAQFTPTKALSLSASIVFEQSYGGIDGDSASSTELYAILSAISELPIKQSLAVTGSVNQFGEVQAIGGVNEKIEGFYATCKANGLETDNGVLIPQANVSDLMLRHDLVEAVEAGKFHIYPVKTIEQGIEILTGVPAGRRLKSGKFSKGSVFARVEARLEEFAKKDEKKGKRGNGKAGGNSGDTDRDTDTGGEGEERGQEARAGEAPMSRERRRILIGLNSSPTSLRGLAAAAEMAARLDAELVGLFVEDDNLLRLAELTELFRDRAAVRPLAQPRSGGDRAAVQADGGARARGG